MPRPPRVGLFISGKPSYAGKFDPVGLRYERPRKNKTKAPVNAPLLPPQR